MKNFSLRDLIYAMKTRVFTVFALLVTLALLPGPALASAFSLDSAAAPNQSASAANMLSDASAVQTDTAAKARALEAYGQLPLSFISNWGQVDERVGYYVQSGGQSLWFTADGVTMALPETILYLEFLGANPSARLEGGDKLPGIVNYFIGNDPAKWRTNIPTYGSVTYRDLWPGVDLTYEGRPGTLKSTFTLAPGADPAQIRLAYPAADNLAADGQGNLIISAAGEKVRESAPLAWQEIDGRRVPVAVTYQVAGQSYGFALLEGYDPDYPLVIDPELLYSTFLGGSASEVGWAVAVDEAGNAHVTGHTWSSDFPTIAGAFDTSLDGSQDAFVVKVNAGGTGLAYATFLGGSDRDWGDGIAVDGVGSAYVTGHTDSSDFPTTAEAFDTSHNGDFDVFVVKLNPAGTGLAYSTFLGGNNYDRGLAIAVDGAGSAYVTGVTKSSDFPTTVGAFDTSYNGNQDAFVVKVNAGGTGLAYATFLGEGMLDTGYAIAVDVAGSAYVTGVTWSSNFPTTVGAFDTSYNGGTCDAFVVKLNTSGTGLAYSTFLGGNAVDTGWAIAVDGAGNAYVAGGTYSSDFPTTAGAFDTSLDGSTDAFVVKVNAGGTGLAYATLMGGSDDDYGKAIAMDVAGSAYVTGDTQSSDFPTTEGAFDRFCGTDGNCDFDGSYYYDDAFVVEVNAAGTDLAYATFLGGSDSDDGKAIAVDGAGSAYVTGVTWSSDFPITAGAFDTSYNGGSYDAFVAKLDLGGGELVDLSIDSVSPIQVVEGQNLVQNKATAVKVVVRKTGNEAVNNVSAKVTYSGASFSRFYVADAANLDANFTLKQDNTAYPLNFSASEIIKTIYFFNDGLTPTGSSFIASATVDYLSAIPESNESNNTTWSPSFSVHDTQWSGERYPDLYAHYFRMDWGSTPLVDFNDYYQNSGDFLKGVYPVASQRFTPSKSTEYVGNTTLFRGSDGRLNELELGLWVLTTLPQVRIAHPTADRFLAIVPRDWFATTTTGKLQSAMGVAYPAMRALVIAEARSTTRPNGPSIAAHEIGHSYGLRLECEEYYNQDADCARKTQQGAPPDRIGNDAAPGLWVSKRIPIEVTAARKVYCFMGAYDDRECWVDADCFSKLFNDHKTGTSVSATGSMSQAILAVGTFYVTGTVQLDDWYVLPEAELSTLIPGPYSFEYQDVGGMVLHQEPFSVTYRLKDQQLTESPFVFTIPYVTGTAKIIVKYDGSTLAEKTVSAHTPVVTVLSPNGGEELSGQTSITWSASDLDEDTLSYTVLYSTDDGATWEPVAGGLADATVVWSLDGLPGGSAYRVKVVATDGFNTAEDASDSAFTVLSKAYLPIILKSWSS